MHLAVSNSEFTEILLRYLLRIVPSETKSAMCLPHKIFTMNLLKNFTTSFEHLYGLGYTVSIIRSQTSRTIEKPVICYSVNIFHPDGHADERSVKFLQRLRVGIGPQMPGARILSQLHLARKYLAGVGVTLAADPFLSPTLQP